MQAAPLPVTLADLGALPALYQQQAATIARLERKVADLESLTDRPCALAEACEITGLGRTALYHERRRAGTLLKEYVVGARKMLSYRSCCAFRDAHQLGTLPNRNS